MQAERGRVGVPQDKYYLEEKGYHRKGTLARVDTGWSWIWNAGGGLRNQLVWKFTLSEIQDHCLGRPSYTVGEHPDEEKIRSDA